MKKRNAFILLLALLLLLSGAGIALYPKLNQMQHKAEADKAVSDFLKAYGSQIQSPSTNAAQDNSLVAPEANSNSPAGSSFAPTPDPAQFPELLEAMQEYNREIFINGQAGLSDPWAYNKSVFDLTDYGMEGEVIAVLSIPKMDLLEPVYLGATKSHLDHGIAQLSISSMPIGGENTNCVLAGHRGWNGALFFRHIELLEIGDELTITNPWEVLTYRVTEIKIIRPYQAEEVLIQPGRDLVTLVTCHPYGSGGRYRYLVFCERSGTSERR